MRKFQGLSDWIYLLCFRKNVPDYSAGRAKNDLGFIMFDLQADILSEVMTAPPQ